MRKPKGIIIIFIITVLLLISACTLGAYLIYKSNNTDLPASTDISKGETENPTTGPTPGPTIVPSTEPTAGPTAAPTIVPSVEPTTIAANDDQWKQAYIDYVQDTLSKDAWAGYELINLDNDNIPELVAIGNSEAQGNLVCNYYNGTVYSTQLSRLGFYYIEGENLLCNSDGLMDSYYDIVYSIKDGKLTQIAAGNWGELDGTGHHFDKDGALIYQYSWNDVTVTKDEYSNNLNSVFDMSKATDGYASQIYSVDEIKNLIKNY